jgi:hypothetical protein
MSPPGPFPYELRIGVTGHRDLPDPGSVTVAVDRLLEGIKQTLESACEFPRGACGSPKKHVHKILDLLAQGLRFALPRTAPHVPAERRTPITWTVVSPLARGADRIVANAVLKLGNARLQVVTPFAVDDYRRDFKDPQDRAEFEELLKRDASITELPGDYGQHDEKDTPEQAEVKRTLRDVGYLKVGECVVDACEIVIAVWNGKPAAPSAGGASGNVGTRATVAYALERGRVVLWIDSEKPSNPPGMLLKISDDHKCRTLPTTSSGVPYQPVPRTAKKLSSSFHQLAAYNRDSAFCPNDFEIGLEEDLGELRAAAALVSFPPATLVPWLNHFLPHYVRADQLAGKYQRLYRFAVATLYILSAAAVTIAVAQLLYCPEHHWPILLEIAVIGLMGTVFLLSKTATWQEKWLHDRHLAERIRISMFTSLAGFHSTQEQPHTELPFYPGPEGWMIAVVDHIVQTRPQEGAGQADSFDALKRFLAQAWISRQAQWHKDNAHQKHLWAKVWDRIAVFLFGLTFLMASLHYLEGKKLLPLGDQLGDNDWLSLTITFLAIIFPACGAALHGINVLLDRERIAARSQRMHQILATIAARAEQATTLQELRQEIAHAAKVMAAENHEWWVSLSYHDVVLPA